MNNALINDSLVKEEIMKEMKDFLEFNENEDTSYQNLWDTMKAVLREKLIALGTSKKRMERPYTNNLTMHLKSQNKRKQIPARGVDCRK